MYTTYNLRSHLIAIPEENCVGDDRFWDLKCPPYCMSAARLEAKLLDFGNGTDEDRANLEARKCRILSRHYKRRPEFTDSG